MPGLELFPRPFSTGRELRIVFFFSLGLLAACSPSGGQTADDSSPRFAASPEGQPPGQERLPPPGEAWVIFGVDTVRAELARTADERERGLMYRETLEGGRGMLFIFPDSQIRSFWMQNTL
ncbi:MAG: DUF192 domain-containing protein, partial [Longimicrobiales bacterium]